MAIKWSKKISLDDDLLDDEHKFVIKKANMFLDQGKKFIDSDQAWTFLAELREHLLTHMEHEEQFQQSIGYDELSDHKKLHQSLIVELDRILQHLGQFQIFDLTEVNRRTAHFLMHFLVRHMLEEDMKLRAFVSNKNSVEQSPEDIAYL